MNKKHAKLLTTGFLISLSLLTSGFKFWNKNPEETKTPVITQGYESIQNKAWCITFQLVWNDFMDKVNKGMPILLAGGNPTIANELNKRLYTTDELSEDSYYKVNGVINKKLKKQIEKDIKKKFNEKSDIIDLINWNAKNSYLFYAMLKKDFKFETPFDKLESAPFANSEDNVRYFGINKKSNFKLRQNVNALFYNDENDYAVKLLTKQNEELILYKTTSNKSFEELFNYINKQENNVQFGNEDTLTVPNIGINTTITYPELCNKKIKGTNKIISQAIQTIKFNLDNKGGTLKSEAALATTKMSVMHDPVRNYDFSDQFVIFLKEANKEKPYFAAKIENTEYLELDK